MFLYCFPVEPATPEEIETALTETIRSSAGGQTTRNAEVLLAGVCAKHLTDRLMLAGFVFMRRTDRRAAGMTAANASARGQRHAILASPLCKRALDHQIGNQVQRAYLRTDFLEQRRDLAELWAGHLRGETSTR